MSTAFYSFTAKDIKGQEISMDAFKGKTVLVVNTASKCGFTNQFEGLEALYEKYKDRDFVVLGFPCNQFANQEPGDEQSIVNGCMLRSEEHTSELQSRPHLVCRLLLEKKKKNNIKITVKNTTCKN